MSLTIALLALAAASRADNPLAFTSLDRDHDGAVTRAEFDAGARTIFEWIDRDRSGSIDRAEMRSFAMSDLPGKQALMQGGARPKLKFDKEGRMTFSSFADAMWQARFAPKDTNGDGQVSRAEYSASGR